ncbi:MAG: alkaline phosphatase family protein [Candidatus Aminicenantes bacterium]|nr:alkaline phosphatase family protein [Candidatus Aminicenantes bacterium]
MKRINGHPLDRREFLKLGLGAATLLAAGAGSPGIAARTAGRSAAGPKVIILGMDGLDFGFMRRWMDEGKLPTFRKLAEAGGFAPLRTSDPPQSPVAWANFITGTNPGGHGIYDFIHRDPSQQTDPNNFVVFSATATEAAKRNLKIGNYVFPLSGGKVRNLIQGKAFWQLLEDGGVPSTIFKIPANYPPVGSKQRTFVGMGTPDLLGTYGQFNYYTTVPSEIAPDVSGGWVHQVYVIGNRVDTKIPGPVNSFRKDQPDTAVDVRVDIDPVHPVARISVQGQEFLLREKEWSDWKKIRFGLIPTQSVGGIVLFYLKQVHPEFKLYVTPINVDPSDPALPLSTPESYSRELAAKFGPFFTKGLPADTHALDADVLDEDEFLAMDDRILRESLEMFDYELARFNDGLLFYYISSTDQRQHMFYRFLDPLSPVYDPGQAARYGTVVESIYREMDVLLAKALAAADRDTVVITMSDHGFSPFRRTFNLNTWLKANGYHALINERRMTEDTLFTNTDWSRTRAYGVGLNTLYINERGRESEGIVAPGAEKDALVREIARKLEEAVDPKTGERPILHAHVGRDIYSGQSVDHCPDIVLGFNRGSRISWSSPMGTFSKDIFGDNTEKWSGDHMGASEVVPGILFANRPIRAEHPALYDLTASLLALYGIDQPKELVGKPVF